MKYLTSFTRGDKVIYQKWIWFNTRRLRNARCYSTTLGTMTDYIV